MKYFIRIFILVAFVGIAFFSCKNEGTTPQGEAETLVSGTATIYVDNTVQPIVEDVLAVYHNTYDRAAIKQVNLNEQEIIQLLMKDSARIVVLPRKLSESEERIFKNKQITADVTEFATDAVVFITNKKATDSIINLDEIVKVLKGDASGKVKSLVFDNPNSSTVQYLKTFANVSALGTSGIYAMKTNEEVIKFVHDNDGSIGIIGLNWLLQAPPALTKFVENIKVLGVDNVKKDNAVKKYYKPNQDNLATGSYPLTRKLYVLNYQGKQGLGMGFASYIGGIEGQRIILKSGLLPVRIPSREISVRNKIQTTN
ncbi:MAG: phosphate ABC transporter substrate-binding protein [Flavobacterium sp.]|nr:MAG: phosphate ABC transporter substrate-binding protein [Flavobacterium sp.]